MNAPRLRFKEFSEAWEETLVLDFAPLQRGFDLPVSTIVNGDFPVVFSNGILKHHHEYKAVAPGVVTGRSGTIGSVTYVEENYWPHNTSLWVTDFKNNVPKFVYYFYINFDLERFGTGSGVPTLNRNDVHRQKVLIPSFPEQTKIADFLSVVDEKIAQLTQKGNLLARYKKGLMQQIFSQQLRFKDDDGQEFPEWKKKNLSDLLFESKKRNYNLIFNKESVLSVSGEFGIVNQIDFLGRSYAGESVANYPIVETGDIVYTKSPLKLNPYGIIKVNKGGHGIVSTLYAVYKCKESVSGMYLDYYFQLDDNLNKYLRPLVRKGAKNDMKINNSHVLSGEIFFPEKEEQEKIAAFFVALDDKINLAQTQLNALKQYKQGLLQQMFV